MKKLLKWFLSFVESFNKARAASILAKNGRPDLAAKMMQDK